MLSVMIAAVWRSTPFVAMILLAGLLALPREPFEAAEVDGASGWQQFRYLTFPLMLPLMLLALSIRLLDGPRAFDLVYLLTEGGPAKKTEVLLIYIYREAWQSFQLGYAAAASYVMVFIQMALLAVQVRLVWRLRAWR
jgi:multiple sugar transport system permease protein